jgi:hypothetical protein
MNNGGKGKMKNMLTVLIIICVAGFAGFAGAGLLDDVVKELPRIKRAVIPESAVDEKTAVSGIKEALSIGTKKAVGALSKTDGYFANEMVKILLPDKIQQVANLAAKIGFQPQVDAFILSMNRAAEAAAPKAAGLFADALKAMSLDDALKILRGGDTAATEYFRDKTSQKIYDAFKPVVVANMEKVGVAKAYKNMVTPAKGFLPSSESVDIDHYVTQEALDGLFYMVGEEEKKIRTDPAARVTDLLKTVFGKQR